MGRKGSEELVRKLRRGYTTGACAAAAAKAAAAWKFYGTCPENIEITLEGEQKAVFSVIALAPFQCGILKDAGDDPDVTDGCMICAHFCPAVGGNKEITFQGGEGIGIVTKPGLKLEVGEPAINPAPRKYIEKNVRDIIGNSGAVITISIPGGEKLAKQTFNPRLGIHGGLSVLGTTGIVNPMSEEAVKESLALELSMHHKANPNQIVLCVSGAGERIFRKIYPDVSCVMQMSNFAGFMLDKCKHMSFREILIFGGTGKLTKLAADIMNTHSHVAGGVREVICTHAALLGADSALVSRLFSVNTTKEAENILRQYHMEEVWKSIAAEGKRCCEKRCEGSIGVEIVITGYDQSIIASTQNAKCLIEKMKGKGSKSYA